ncbi:MAG: phosphoribosylamine--glycine ligase [Pseudomonadota bacterium]
MNVLILGGGGREHALAWKVAQSKHAEKIYVAPGNAGTARDPRVINVPIDSTNIEKLLAFAREEEIDLTIVGPEAPLVAGVVDTFVNAGLLCLGPTQAAAQLEGSKSFTKKFLQRHSIPTAGYKLFTQAQITNARKYLEQCPYPQVIKADGLAAGKGVVIVQNVAEGLATINSILLERRFGNAGEQIVIEEFLKGEEASFIVLADGEDFVCFASSQDHKALGDGDTGPNTGGMGAYSPAPVVTDELHKHILETIIRPTLRGLKKDGIHYRGFLYAGLMIDGDDIKVLEFNCRLGDPETQPILMRLESDFLEVCWAAVTKGLKNITLKWHTETAVGVVLANRGYPDDYPKTDAIQGLENFSPLTTDVQVFHSGTKIENDKVIANGGRVLCVTALGKTVALAQQKVYQAIERIKWTNKYCRTDIGYRAVQYEEDAKKNNM